MQTTSIKADCAQGSNMDEVEQREAERSFAHGRAQHPSPPSLVIMRQAVKRGTWLPGLNAVLNGSPSQCDWCISRLGNSSFVRRRRRSSSPLSMEGGIRSSKIQPRVLEGVGLLIIACFQMLSQFFKSYCSSILMIAVFLSTTSADSGLRSSESRCERGGVPHVSSVVGMHSRGRLYPSNDPRTSRLKELNVGDDANCSSWKDIRMQFNRAMAQLQSNAHQPSAKETAKELNCWLMHLLSQPDANMNSHERKALLLNLKRISQLQKENLRLKLEHATRSEAPIVNSASQNYPVRKELAPSQRTDRCVVQTELSKPGATVRRNSAAQSYAFHRPGARSSAPQGSVGTAPSPFPPGQQVSRNQICNKLGASNVICEQRDAGGQSTGTNGELGAALRQLDQMRELNRQLAHEVSALVNENLRLKSVLHQAQSSLLEAAVAQVSPMEVAAERAVPDVVKAAATLLHDRNGPVLQGGTDPLERGLVMASAALLKRTALHVGDRVQLKRNLSRDRLGTSVNSTGGAFLGVLIGEAGEEDATVYLHMDDNQVRQFSLSEIDLPQPPESTTPAEGGSDDLLDCKVTESNSEEQSTLQGPPL
uniref:Uncharacterized protein n=1 Tax=Guillardia theta TaxID=55529 RepID=A0A7S4K7A4_GUITH|mmetsp:Transcript_21637/g.71614  ORF Transcript_21637/g.71614 Transcript_21637/m.71614 type:complete len:593 (-) Transcript_21637:68-1846(-)